MTNNLNERKSYAVIIAAVVTSLIIMIGGMTSGLILAVRMRQDQAPGADGGHAVSGYLLEDSAYNLKSAVSALRLCNESEPAEALCRTALVHAVRAETALECHYDDWADSRTKEAFLNDISAVLHSAEPKHIIAMADVLYEYASRFFESVSSGETFKYDGELIPREDVEHDVEITDEDIARGAEAVKKGTGADDVKHVGAWNGHIEYYTERDGATGYAVVCNGKVIEYSFMRDDEAQPTDERTAREVALATAEACGYGGLTVKWSAVTGKSVSVIMCKEYDGALACDDYATAVVYDGKVVAFSAGGCEHEHTDIPSPKKTEGEARAAVKGNGGAGTLVVRTVNGKERICYEYRVELDDGMHYVYVCAESGKQMEVK